MQKQYNEITPSNKIIQSMFIKCHNVQRLQRQRLYQLGVPTKMLCNKQLLHLDGTQSQASTNLKGWRRPSFRQQCMALLHAFLIYLLRLAGFPGRVTQIVMAEVAEGGFSEA